MLFDAVLQGKCHFFKTSWAQSECAGINLRFCQSASFYVQLAEVVSIWKICQKKLGKHLIVSPDMRFVSPDMTADLAAKGTYLEL